VSAGSDNIRRHARWNGQKKADRFQNNLKLDSAPGGLHWEPISRSVLERARDQATNRRGGQSKEAFVAGPRHQPDICDGTPGFINVISDIVTSEFPRHACGKRKVGCGVTKVPPILLLSGESYSLFRIDLRC